MAIIRDKIKLNKLSGKQKSLLIIIFLIPFLVIDVIKYFTIPENAESVEKIEIVIPRGAGLSQIADTLSRYELIKDKKLFILWASSLGYETKLKAGLFEVPSHLNYAQLISFLSKAKQSEINITLIEGWDNDQIGKEFERKLKIDKTRFDSLCIDPGFITKLGLKQTNLRGYLLPNTYSFYWGVSEEDVIKFLVKQTLAIFKPDSVRQALKHFGMNVHQILTFASIVEGEAIFDDERDIIASVYHNRLRRGIKLQADPTIQFIIKGPPRRVLYRDLENNSPYNTYKYYGLPPGPINNPGKLSILAALFPAKTKYIFFVAKGDGRHTFSRNAVEHSRAKADFDKVRREVNRKNRRKKVKENK